MALPNFLGVGFFRCGTTWLHDLLDSHPDCYMPQAFKEVHFFADKHFPRGQAWYESFFPVDTEKFKAIGEIGPRYAKPGQVERCLERIATFPSLADDGRFLFIIRNHVDRAYSGYKQASASRGALSFDDYRREHEAEKGPLIQPFAPTIDAYRQRFGPERVLVVRLEDAYGDPANTRGRIADFLGLDPTRFPSDAGGAAANASDAAMRGPVYRAAARVNVWLIRNGMHHLSGRLRRLG
ncbi:MAG: sulfotransferase, partial [Planctomycetota bacterium]